MAKNSSTESEHGSLKVSMAEVEGELRWLKELLAGSLSFMMYLVWR